MKKHLPYASCVKREAYLDGDLPMLYGGLIDVTAHLFHLEPAQAVQRFARAFERVVDGLFNRLRGRAGELDNFVNVIVHNGSKIRSSVKSANLQARNYFENLDSPTCLYASVEVLAWSGET